MGKWVSLLLPFYTPRELMKSSKPHLLKPSESLAAIENAKLYLYFFYSPYNGSLPRQFIITRIAWGNRLLLAERPREGINHS